MRGTANDRQVDWHELSAVWDAMAPWRQANPHATPQEIRAAAAHYLARTQPGNAAATASDQPAPDEPEADGNYIRGFSFPAPATPSFSTT
jgi:hypothetical protein